jgi:hypothetical protein
MEGGKLTLETLGHLTAEYDYYAESKGGDGADFTNRAFYPQSK